VSLTQKLRRFVAVAMGVAFKENQRGVSTADQQIARRAEPAARPRSDPA